MTNTYDMYEEENQLFKIGDIVQARTCVANHDCKHRAGPPGINPLMKKYAQEKRLMRIVQFDGHDYLCVAYKATLKNENTPWWYPSSWLAHARAKKTILNALRFDLVI